MPVFSPILISILNKECVCGKISRHMEKYMREALKEAEIAYAMGEVPVGAVIVKDGEIIARGHNLTETEKEPTAHAEIVAIRRACEKLGGRRLLGCDLYVTVEPCCMCAGAIVWARFDRLFIGAPDPKEGACGSLYNIPQDERLNHYVEITTGVLMEEAQELMKSFFKDLREKKRQLKSEN